MFCSKFYGKLKGLYKKFDGFLQAHVDDALRITSAIKTFLESPTAGLLTMLIPTDYDELARKMLLSIISKSIDVLSIVDACKGITDLEMKIVCFASEINKRSPELRDALLVKLAALITKELDGKRYPQNVYDAFVQGKYTAAK